MSCDHCGYCRCQRKRDVYDDGPLLVYVGQDSVVVGDFVVAHQGAVEGSVLA